MNRFSKIIYCVTWKIYIVVWHEKYTLCDMKNIHFVFAFSILNHNKIRQLTSQFIDDCPKLRMLWVWFYQYISVISATLMAPDDCYELIMLYIYHVFINIFLTVAVADSKYWWHVLKKAKIIFMHCPYTWWENRLPTEYGLLWS